MMGSQKRLEVQITQLAVIFDMLWFASGCAGAFFYHPEDAEIVIPEPLAPGMTRVIFMRPKNLGTTGSASILDVTSEPFRYAGEVGIKEKIAYDVAPGDHLFMVLGVRADFMSATLEEDKTYYTEVVPQVDLARLIVRVFISGWVDWYGSGWVDWYGQFDLRAIHQEGSMNTGPKGPTGSRMGYLGSSLLTGYT
jgi:hypothetical protein